MTFHENFAGFVRAGAVILGASAVIAMIAGFGAGGIAGVVIAYYGLRAFGAGVPRGRGRR